MLSGKSVGGHTSMRHVSTMGARTILRRSAEWDIPLSLDLSPDMNPLRCAVSAHYAPPIKAGLQSTQYVATLKKEDGETVWEEKFSISARRDEKKNRKKNISIGVSTRTTNKSIKTFSVQESGTYDLKVLQKGENDIIVDKLDIGISRNVAIPSVPVVISGFVLLLAGGVVLFLGKKA